MVPELNGEWHAKEVESGVKDPTRAVIRFTPPPGCASSRTTGLSFVSVGIPIGNDLNGIQSEPDVRIVTVRSVSFAIVQDRRGARFALKGRDAMVNFAERLWWARQQNQVLLPGRYG